MRLMKWYSAVSDYDLLGSVLNGLCVLIRLLLPATTEV